MAALGKVQVGRPAPNFEGLAVVDGKLKNISLASYTDAHHWLILAFFPKAWSFICPTEIKAFSARLEEFIYNRSCAIAFCSTDNEHSLMAWNSAPEVHGGLGGVHVPLISDCSRQISRDYGVLDEEEGVAHRALFIIDPTGRVRNITVNDTDVGRSVDEIQRVLDALLFNDAFGKGCPADWKRGDEGIDSKTKTSVDGAIVIPMAKRTTWSEWARPKLQRAWSNTSGMSVTSNMGQSVTSNMAVPTRLSYHERARSNSNLNSTNSSVRPSPAASPLMRLSGINHFDDQMAEALMAPAVDRGDAVMENMRAALQNQSLGVVV